MSLVIKNEQVYTFVEDTMQTKKTTIREHILQAATHEFKTKGYENASLRSIAMVANISVGNVYHYFDNKEHLFASVVKHVLERFQEVFNVKIGVNENPHAAFTALAHTLSHTLYELIGNDKDALLVALRHRHTSHIILTQLTAFLSQLATQWSHQPLHMNAQKHMDYVIDMLAHGLLQGCIRGVELSSISESTLSLEAIQMYFQLHTYMIFAIEGAHTTHETTRN